MIGLYLKLDMPGSIPVEALKCLKRLAPGPLSLCRTAEDFIEQFAQHYGTPEPHFVIASSSDLTGFPVVKQSRLGRPLDEIRRALQIVAGIDHAMAVHSVGEIERQIPAEKLVVHGT